MNREHYRTSVVAVHRQITRVCSQSSGRNSRFDDERPMEVPSSIGEASRRWNPCVFSASCSGESLAERPRLSQDRRVAFLTFNGGFEKNQKEPAQIRPSFIRTRKQEATAVTATVAENESTFQWQMYSSYEKLLRIVAYMLRLLPKSDCNRTKTGFVDDPAEVEVA